MLFSAYNFLYSSQLTLYDIFIIFYHLSVGVCLCLADFFIDYLIPTFVLHIKLWMKGICHLGKGLRPGHNFFQPFKPEFSSIHPLFFIFSEKLNEMARFEPGTSRSRNNAKIKGEMMLLTALLPWPQDFILLTVFVWLGCLTEKASKQRLNEGTPR